MNWLQSSRALALGAVLLGLLSAPAALAGDPWSLVWSPGGLGLGFLLDVVSVVLLIFVGSLGWIVISYSRTNLRGRHQIGAVGAAAFATLATLLLTVTGASLVSIAIGWTASGLSIAALVSLSGTPDAPAAARVMRRALLAGDAFLWAAVALGLALLPSLERTRLDEIQAGWEATVVALLLLGACVARSGLFPAHRWLPETAEAPSPVSAMLHAGIVNGAGVLTLLAWPLVAAAPLALLGLLFLGAASVLVGAWGGRVRTDVKGRLACSTTAQMGYMSIQLGLGLPAAALLHLVAHGAYKSWLFLRAGGAVGRTRAQVVPESTSSPARALHALVAVALATAIGATATALLVDASGVTALVPALLGVGAAGLAGHAVSGLARTDSRLSWVVAATSGVMGGTYLWVLVGAEEVLETSLAKEALWGTAAGAVLVAFVVAVAALVVAGARRLDSEPDGALAVSLLPTALAPTRHPWSRRRSLPRPASAGTTTAHAHDVGIERGTVVTAVRLSSNVVGPAWPLRSFVAANSLARLETMPFDDALDIAGRAYGVTGRASLDYFLDQYDGARITPDHVAVALAELSPVVDLVEGWSVEQLVGISRDLIATYAHDDPSLGQPAAPTVRRFCEGLSGNAGRVAAEVDAHSALWAQRAWSRATWEVDAAGTPSPEPGPWVRWRRAAEHPAYDRAVGIRGAAAAVAALPTEPAEALGTLAAWADLSAEDLMGYLVATFASAPGWSGHAAWRARTLVDASPLLEWAALRMAHDVIFSAGEESAWPTRASREAAAASPAPKQDGARRLATSTARVWQRALEIGIEEWLVSSVAAPEEGLAGPSQGRPTSQSIWCIDVRSERMRRRLEQVASGHRTFGYAGFFGATLRHVDLDGITHECCPALVTSSFATREKPAPLTFSQAVHRTVTSVSRHPLGALVVAEAGGGLAAAASLGAEVVPGSVRRLHQSWTQGTSIPVAPPELVDDLDLDVRTGLATAALRTIGLTEDFAPVLLVCGHGASMENNAFASAYDCGACGGNSGRINAVLLAGILNDPEVRARLAADGIQLPDDTVAVAAMHDTTTDLIHLLSDPALPDPTRAVLAQTIDDLRTAGLACAAEREKDLPAGSSAQRRSVDWSEPTPEWGLGGNAAIFFGPRELTAAADLGGRVFLHSYDRDSDTDGSILEVLLTAPLVVAQWINAQYYFSSVEPAILGAGDKACHNVVGDVGVILGAHGDLQTGLPWQALFRDQPGTRPDAESLAHEPVRLLAMVVADPEAISRVVERHDVLKQLIGNRWISLVCSDRGRMLRLTTDLTWQPWRDVEAVSPLLRDDPDTAPAAGSVH